MSTAAMFTSTRHDWETPDALFQQLNREFAFMLDAAASSHNAPFPCAVVVFRRWRPTPRISTLCQEKAPMIAPSRSLTPPPSPRTAEEGEIAETEVV